MEHVRPVVVGEGFTCPTLPGLCHWRNLSQHTAARSRIMEMGLCANSTNTSDQHHLIYRCLHRSKTGAVSEAVACAAWSRGFSGVGYLCGAQETGQRWDLGMQHPARGTSSIIPSVLKHFKDGPFPGLSKQSMHFCVSCTYFGSHDSSSPHAPHPVSPPASEASSPLLQLFLLQPASLL